jgi:pyrroloquinoline quinone biosynthesis protein B
LRIIVLGAAAGGGFPQWNSNAPGCARARRGDTAALPRSQTSVAVSGQDRRWVLLNASPDLRWQIEATPALHPGPALRSSPIAAVVLTGGDVDAIAGLLHLREGHAFSLYAAPAVLEILDANPIFDVLPRNRVVRHELPFDAAVELRGPDGPLGLTVEAFAVPGKRPLYLEGDDFDATPNEAGDTIGLAVIDQTTGRRFHFIPGCALVNDEVLRRVADTDLLLFDGTLWQDDELVRLGASDKTGRRMGHISMDGAQGAMARLAGQPIKRRVFIHINNSNPVLLADSPQRRQVEAAGWEVAYDGMELRL